MEHSPREDNAAAAAAPAAADAAGGASSALKSQPSKQNMAPSDKAAPPSSSVSSQAAPSFSQSLLRRGNQSLQDRFKVFNVPEPTLEWCVKAFSLYSPDCSTEIDPWEMKQALLSFGKPVTDGDLYDMLKQQGRVVGGEDMTINFREFANMCWKQFFEPVVIDDQVNDVQQAFVILGGAADGSGEVSVSKLKTFTEETELTIDVDKFVAEVDDDGSGLVDFTEFCQLFKDRTGDTNLHTPGGQHWLRQESESLTKPPPKIPDPLDVGAVVSPIIRPQRSKHEVNDESSGDNLGDMSRASLGIKDPASPSLIGSPGAKSVGRDEAVPTSAPPAPRAKKGGKQLDPNAGLPLYRANNTVVTCRRGWRFSQLRKNVPGSEGYNTYAVRTMEFRDLDKMVKMRSRGAEFCVKEEAGKRMDLRPSSEMRLVKIMRPPSMSRPGTSLGILESYQGDSSPASSPARASSPLVSARPSTSMGLMPTNGGRGGMRPGASGVRPGTQGGGSSPLSMGARTGHPQKSLDLLSSSAPKPATSMGMSRNAGSRRVLSHERGGQAGRSRPGTSLGVGGGRAGSMQALLASDDKLSLLDLNNSGTDKGGGGARGGEGGGSAVSLPSERKWTSAWDGPKPWQDGMRKPRRTPTTEELLKRAAEVGLYSGKAETRDMGRDQGAGISFFDA